MHKIAIEMHLPEGKRPGYYSQVVKALADVPLFDRDKETLIVSDESGREAVAQLMQHYKFEYEELDLLLLPDDAVTYAEYDDYGFESRSGNRYLYQHLISLFQFNRADEHKELEQALLQMEEHLIAHFERNDAECYAVDQTFKPLMEGIAKAYSCSLIWLDSIE
ncbi:MAG: hypothetical protein K0Q81_1248 [Paenibacillus sp.]|jgi:hypothetical protein|nr:hypothetical protein [Paenibacillus sp.]